MASSRLVAAILVALAAPSASPSPGAATGASACRMGEDDRIWLASALTAWRAVERGALGVDPEPLPWILLFDEACVWHLGAAPATAAASGVELRLPLAQGEVAARGEAHGGKLRTPDGGELPVAITSFAATYGAPDVRPFLAMALPGVWRRVPRHADDPGLGRLMRAVFAHEMTHTRQSRGLGAAVTRLAERHGLGDELDDDVIQKRFGERPGFRAAYEAERDLLYAAAAATDPALRRELAARASAALAERRARYFTGPDRFYAELEELFLGFEGAANWVGYQVVRGEGVETGAALDFLRRGGRFWSQDEGLALFLVIDRGVPGWPRRVLSDRPAAAFDLLAEAAR